MQGPFVPYFRTNYNKKKIKQPDFPVEAPECNSYKYETGPFISSATLASRGSGPSFRADRPCYRWRASASSRARC